MGIDPSQEKRGLKPIPLFFSLLTVVSLICGYTLFKIPSDQKNAFILGLSLERVVMLAFFLLIALASLIGAIIFNINQQKNASLEASILACKEQIKRIASVTAVLSGGLLLMPDYRFGQFSAYFHRLRPFLFLLFWVGFSATLILIVFLDSNIFKRIKDDCRQITGKPFFIFLGLFLLTILFIYGSGWGIVAGKEAWYGNAVPVESLQIVLIIGFLLLLSPFMTKIGRVKLFRNRAFLFFLIWGIAAFTWSMAPMQAHFFAPGPYPPNYEYYPYSDALLNDVAAQTAVYGLKFYHGTLVLKPFVTFVIYLCTLLSGNQMNLTLLIQSAIFAVLPAILFLFASDLGGLFSGFLAAALMIFQEWNALHTTQILTIHSRLEMSEFLAEVLFAAFAYFIFKWFRQGRKQTYFAAAAGGVLGLLIYTRFNFVAMIPAIILFGGIVFHKKIKRGIRDLLIFLLSFVICISPWVVRSYHITGTIAPEILDSFKSVVVEQRLKPITETSEISVENKEPVQATAEPVLQQHTEATPAIGKQIEKETETQLKSFSLIPDEIRLKVHPLIDTIGNHFFHNLFSIAFILPVQIQFDDLNHLYTAEDSVWRDHWNGSLSAGQILFLIINLILISIGLNLLWKKESWAGLSAAYLLIVYAAGLGLARTSGGRYIVPMNWGVLLIYSIGLAVILKKITPIRTDLVTGSTEISNQTIGIGDFGKLVLITGIFFMAYFSMILIEKNTSPSIPSENELIVTEKMKETFPDQDWTKAETQLREGKMRLFQGVALYPRFYYFNQGEHGTDKAYAYQLYSRIIFKILFDNGESDIVLPLDKFPDTFPDQSSVAVIGCLEPGSSYIKGIAVIGQTPDGKEFHYLRSPMKEIACPIPEPVCPEVNKCY